MNASFNYFGVLLILSLAFYQCSPKESANRRNSDIAEDAENSANNDEPDDISNELKKLEKSHAGVSPEEIADKEHLTPVGNAVNSKSALSDDAFSSISSVEGGIVDGNSGNIITFQNNPWFLANIDKVDASFSYCLKFESEIKFRKLYSISIKDARELIRIALDNWNEVITAAQKTFSSKKERNQVELDSQVANLNFVDKQAKFVVSQSNEVDCDKKPDLIFLFSENDSTDLANLNVTKSKIALAWRTKYDSTKLWSNGLIWIAPDLAEVPISPIERIWSHFWRFHAVILHELGHVYAFPHESIEIMRESFPLEITTSSNASFNHLQQFNFSYKSENLLTPDSFFSQSWIYSSKLIERYVSVSDLNKVSPAEINALEVFSGKKLFLGLPMQKSSNTGKDSGDRSTTLSKAKLLSIKHNIEASVFGKNAFIQSSRGVIKYDEAGPDLKFGIMPIYYGIMKGFSINTNFERMYYKAPTSNNTWEYFPKWLFAVPPKNDHYSASFTILLNNLAQSKKKYSVLLEKKSFGRDLEIRIFNDEEIYISFFKKIISDDAK